MNPERKKENMKKQKKERTADRESGGNRQKKGSRKKLVAGILAILLLAAAAAAVYAYPRLRDYRIDRAVWYPKAPHVDRSRQHIVCVGDSITYGAGVFETRDRESWPAFLEQELGSGWQVLNYGLNGRTMLHDGDSPYVNERFYEKVLKTGAEICIIMLGTNDSKPGNWDGHAEAFREDYLSFLDAYRQKRPETQIYLMQPPKCYPEERTGRIVYTISDDNIREEICGIVAEIAEETGCGLIDLYSLTDGHPEWFVDGVHPNAEGNRNIAAYIREQIADSL